MLSPNEVKIVLEAALLASQEPLPVSELRRMFDDEIDADTLRALLEELREAWSGRGVELVVTASGWRFQTKASLQKFLERIHPERAPRYSRAVLETLAIVAYRQPVTRGDIEGVRGVSVSTEVMRRLEELPPLEDIVKSLELTQIPTPAPQASAEAPEQTAETPAETVQTGA